jgi:DNA-binding NarL/FixJ family response regulator
MTPVRVLLVEDHPLLQEALRTVLSPHCTVVQTLHQAEDVSHGVRSLQPDVLVLDLSLPGRSGMHVLPEVRRQFPNLGIVVATNYTEPEYRSQALQRGADSFVGKQELTEELWLAVQTAYSAHRYDPQPVSSLA